MLFAPGQLRGSITPWLPVIPVCLPPSARKRKKNRAARRPRRSLSVAWRPRRRSCGCPRRRSPAGPAWRCPAWSAGLRKRFERARQRESRALSRLRRFSSDDFWGRWDAWTAFRLGRTGVNWGTWGNMGAMLIYLQNRSLRTHSSVRLARLGLWGSS